MKMNAKELDELRKRNGLDILPDTPLITLKEFVEKSTIHQDYLNAVDCRIEFFRTLLEDPELALTGRDYDMFRGAIRKMRQLKELFFEMVEDLESERENQEIKTSNDGEE